MKCLMNDKYMLILRQSGMAKINQIYWFDKWTDLNKEGVLIWKCPTKKNCLLK